MPQSTAEKLGIKPGATALILGLPLAEAATLLGTLPDAVSLVATGEPRFDIVLMFADTTGEVRERAASAFERTKPDGRFWIAYRKGAGRKLAGAEPPPLHRDTLQLALAELRLDGVTLISIDDTWSAMRVRAVTPG